MIFRKSLPRYAAMGALAGLTAFSGAANATLFLGAWDSGTVYSVDLSTEVATPLRSGFGLISGMEGIGDDLFVFDQRDEGVTQLDPVSGATVSFSTLASNVVRGEGTFAMRADRTGFTSNSSGSDGEYFSFDLNANTTTSIGTGISFDGLDFAPDGRLYALSQASSTTGGSELYILDPDTGSTTLIGSTGVTSGALAGLVVADGDFIAGIGSSLYRIDPTDGSADFLFDPGIGNISGAAFLGSSNPIGVPGVPSGPSTSVPAPGGLVLMVAGLFGLFGLRRRRGFPAAG